MTQNQPSNPTPPEKGFRAFLGRNKIYFETLGWLLFSVMAGLVSWWAVLAAEHQNEIGEKEVALLDLQTSLARTQTELARTQTELARTSILPEFHFDYAASPPGLFLVKNKGKPTRNLRGTCVPYIEFDMKDGTKKRLELEGFYANRNEATLRSGDLHFFNPLRVEAGMWLLEALWPYRGNHTVQHFVEMKYFNLINEEREEKYVMEMQGYFVQPVTAMPKMDAQVDLKPFFHDDKEDYDGATKALDAAILAMTGERPEGLRPPIVEGMKKRRKK